CRLTRATASSAAASAPRPDARPRAATEDLPAPRDWGAARATADSSTPRTTPARDRECRTRSRQARRAARRGNRSTRSPRPHLPNRLSASALLRTCGDHIRRQEAGVRTQNTEEGHHRTARPKRTPKELPPASCLLF